MLNKYWLRLVFGLLIFTKMVYAQDSVNITADRMEIIKKGELNLFKENVKLSFRQVIITADELKHFIPQQKVEAAGDVRFVQQADSGEKLEILSQKVVYDYKKQYCLVPCTSTLFYIPENKPEERINLTSRETEFFGEEKRILAQGDIQAIYQQYQIQSGVLEYLEEAGKMVLTEQPKIYYQNEKSSAQYTGEKIIVLREEEKVIIEGDVKGIIYAKSKE